MGQCYTTIIEKVRSSPTSIDKVRSSPTSIDKKKAIEIVNKDGMKLKDLPRHLRSDKDVVLCAIKQNSLSIEFADPEIYSDPQILSFKFVAQQDEQASC